MFEKIRELFSDSVEQSDDSEAALHLAAAVLLVEVAKSDHSVDEEEILQMRAMLQRDWQVDEADLDGLMAVARDVSDVDASLQQHIDLINRNFSPARKLDLVRSLWQAACADDQIHHREERSIRRLADLLSVSDAEFIRSKHWAIDSQEGD